MVLENLLNSPPNSFQLRDREQAWFCHTSKHANESVPLEEGLDVPYEPFQIGVRIRCAVSVDDTFGDVADFPSFIVACCVSAKFWERRPEA